MLTLVDDVDASLDRSGELHLISFEHWLVKQLMSSSLIKLEALQVEAKFDAAMFECLGPPDDCSSFAVAPADMMLQALNRSEALASSCICRLHNA